MLRHAVLLLVAVALLAAKGHAAPVALDVHADSAFTPEEQVLILRAAKELDVQTLGAVHVRIAFDFDWSDINVVRRMSTMHALFRVQSGAQLVSEIDTQTKAHVLGWCDRPNHWMYLVVDRLQSDDEIAHVAMHEMLHDIGVDHVDDPRALMWPTATANSRPVLNAVDLRAIAAATR